MNLLTELLTYKVPQLEHELSNVNSGGCGVVAMEMHKALKVHGIKSSVVLVDQGTGISKHDVKGLIAHYNAKGINSALRAHFKDNGWGKPDTCNDHVCLLVDGVLYDGEGTVTSDVTVISKHITPQTMELWLDIDDEWNQYFNRKNRCVDIVGTLKTFLTNAFHNLRTT